MLKIATSVIAPLLCPIINVSIATGSFPSSWKRTFVKPMLKVGPQDVLSNYRSISVLPVVSNIPERVVKDKVRAHLEHRLSKLESLCLEEHNLLSPWKSEFHAGHHHNSPTASK